MVKIMENPIKMDDLGGTPPIFGNTHVVNICGKQLFLTIRSIYWFGVAPFSENPQEDLPLELAKKVGNRWKVMLLFS